MGAGNRPTRALLAGGLLLAGGPALGASCCGGGSASSLILPKFNEEMVGLTLDVEEYHGFWNQQGEWTPDPPGAQMSQYRMNAGYARRLGDNWQGAVGLPWVLNRNHYNELTRNTQGLGDTTLSLWYEHFDAVTCVYKVRRLQDLQPALYLGGTLTVPTGISPYDTVADNFDITGRGFYRLDASALVEKTIYPWNASMQYTYGIHLERPVNREYGNAVEPYHRQLGDRATFALSGGYTWFLESLSTLTATLAWAHLHEEMATIDGARDPTSGLERRTVSATLAWANNDKSWVVKGTFSHSPQEDGWGSNFPATDTITLGVSHVLR